MIRWSMLMILSVATVCCLAATNADDKDKPAEKTATKTEKAESNDSKEAKPESAEKKTAPKKDKEKSGAEKKDGDKKEEKFTAKCPVSGEAATKEQFTAYKEKQVYFCCDKCKAAFEAEPAKFEVNANHQLAQTKQFVQKKCPMTGGPIDKEQSARVSNVMVRFCCEKCKGSVQSATAAEKLEMIFSEKAFKKAYVAVKVESKDGSSKEKVTADKSEKLSEKKTEKAKEKAVKKTDTK
jgi:YHS domain-containing protein